MRTIILSTFLVVGFLATGCAQLEKEHKLSSKEAPTTLTTNNTEKKHTDVKWRVDGKEIAGDSASFEIASSGEHTLEKIYTKKKKTDTIMQKINVEEPEKCLIKVETSLGNMVLELFEDTPEHKNNFLKLVNEGFYNDLLFHRVISGFMVQGGDPESRNAPAGKSLGSGGPGYTVPAEFNPAHVHTKGALSAARTGDAVNPERRSSGSQFYIVQGKPVPANQIEQMGKRLGITYTPAQIAAYTTEGGTPFLDMQYTVYGQVVEGLDVIDKIAAVKTARGDRPLEDVKMKMTVIK